MKHQPKSDYQERIVRFEYYLDFLAFKIDTQKESLQEFMLHYERIKNELDRLQRLHSRQQEITERLIMVEQRKKNAKKESAKPSSKQKAQAGTKAKTKSKQVSKQLKLPLFDDDE